MENRPGTKKSRKKALPEGAPRTAPPIPPKELLSAAEAAGKLGISTTTFYSWLGQSNHGLLIIRGRNVTIDYLQGGPRGQGRIAITTQEVGRIRDLMRVRPQPARARREHGHRQAFPGINVPLGRPDDVTDV